MSDCIVMIGASRAEQEEFVQKFKKEKPKICVVSHESTQKQLYGKRQGKSTKLEKNFLYDKIYTYLAQGKDVLLIDGPLRISERKQLLGYINDVEDARVSCLSFSSARIDKNYQPPTVDEGWQGIANMG